MEDTEKTPFLAPRRSEMLRVHTTRHGLVYALTLLTHLGALLLMAFSLSTGSWLRGQAYGRTVKLGLWQACLDDVCQSFQGSGHEIIVTIGGWLVATEVLAVIGFGVSALSLLMVAYVYIRDLRHSHPKDFVLTSLTTSAGAVIYWIALILFIYKSHSSFSLAQPDVDLRLGYSGFFGIVASTVELLVAILYLVEYWRNITRPSMGYVPL